MSRSMIRSCWSACRRRSFVEARSVGVPLLGDNAREVLDSSAGRRLALYRHLQLPTPPGLPAALFELCPSRARVRQVPLRLREFLHWIRSAAVDGEDGGAFVLKRGHKAIERRPVFRLDGRVLGARLVRPIGEIEVVAVPAAAHRRVARVRV